MLTARKTLSFAIIIGTLVSPLGLIATVSAKNNFTVVLLSDVAGSGSAGSGSLAVAAFFSPSGPAIVGSGGFSGNMPVGIGGTNFDAIGLFNLTETNPPDPFILPCSVESRVSAAGTVTSGSFLGDRVLVAGCIGTGPVMLNLTTPSHCLPGCVDYAGQGNGIVTTTSSSVKESFAGAGVSIGVGSSGIGTMYSVQSVVIAKDGTLLGGGVSVGTDINSGTVWQINKASLQSGCQLSTTGVTVPIGAFPNQPVTSSYTLTTCPPISGDPQTARSSYTIGGDAAPIYKGAGVGTVTFSGPPRIFIL